MIANRWLRITCILMISTVYLITFSHYGVMAFDAFLYKGAFKPGTQIASVNIEKMTKAEAVTKLEKRLATWFSEENLQVTINEENLVIGQDYFIMDLPDTVEKAKDGKDNKFNVRINQAIYEAELKSRLNEQFNLIDHNQLQEILVNSVNNMANEKQFFTIQAFMKNDLNSIAAENNLTTSFNRNDVQKVLDALGTVVVPAQSQVSFLDLIKEKGKLPQEALSVVSSSLYKTILLTNFVVIERHTSQTLPDFIELGLEASIVPEKSDLKWFNPNQTDYNITFQLTEEGLYSRVSGAPFLQSYTIKFKDQTSYAFKTIVRFTSLLEEGEEVVKVDGRDGLFVKVTREIYDTSGALVESEKISEDFYPPTHKIIETGLINRIITNENPAIVENDYSQSSAEEENDPNIPEEEYDPSEKQVDESGAGKSSVSQHDEIDDNGIWETPTKGLEK